MPLVSHNVLGRLVQVIPALIIYVGVQLVPELAEGGCERHSQCRDGLYRLDADDWRSRVLLSAANSIYSEIAGRQGPPTQRLCATRCKSSSGFSAV